MAFLLRYFSSLIFALTPTALLADVRVAVASNFVAPMSELAQRFEQQSGVRVLISPGSSGKLYAQINNGAPFDVFFSADQQKPALLIKSGKAVASSVFTYARGKLVLWSADKNYLNETPDVLGTARFERLALANPRLAPYGVAASEVLAQLSLTEATQARWVTGENIAQTFQFVSTGNAELGFVALSQIKNAGGSTWHIPVSLYSPINQDAVLLNKHSKDALGFMEFIKSPKTAELIASYGYQVTP